MKIKIMNKETIQKVADLAKKLWPDARVDMLKSDFTEIVNSANDIVFICMHDEAIIGFAHFSLRSEYVEGTE
jgi:aminoglycoside 6'-N-acetyltransferase I